MTIGEQTYGWQESNEVIHITQEAYDSILSQARKDAPVESCGYALGVKGEDGKLKITYNYPLTNIDHSEEHFSLDPKEQFAAIKYARTHGLVVVGGWHSHPASPSRPSPPQLLPRRCDYECRRDSCQGLGRLPPQ